MTAKRGTRCMGDIFKGFRHVPEGHSALTEVTRTRLTRREKNAVIVAANRSDLAVSAFLRRIIVSNPLVAEILDQGLT